MFDTLQLCCFLFRYDNEIKLLYICIWTMRKLLLTNHCCPSDGSLQLFRLDCTRILIFTRCIC